MLFFGLSWIALMIYTTLLYFSHISTWKQVVMSWLSPIFDRRTSSITMILLFKQETSTLWNRTLHHHYKTAASSRLLEDYTYICIYTFDKKRKVMKWQWFAVVDFELATLISLSVKSFRGNSDSLLHWLYGQSVLAVLSIIFNAFNLGWWYARHFHQYEPIPRMKMESHYLTISI